MVNRQGVGTVQYATRVAHGRRLRLTPRYGASANFKGTGRHQAVPARARFAPALRCRDVFATGAKKQASACFKRVG